MRSLAFDSIQNQLFGLTNNSGLGGALYLVSTTTGATTMIGAATNAYANWNGLAFDPNLNLMYALASTPINQADVLFSINTSTGVAVDLGSPTDAPDGPFSLFGLAIDPVTSKLYSVNRFSPIGATENLVYDIDPFTLVATPLGTGTGFAHLTWALAPQQ